MRLGDYRLPTSQGLVDSSILQGGAVGEVMGGGQPLMLRQSAFGKNPFAGKSFTEIDNILRGRDFKVVGPDPAAGRGAYFHPVTGRKYYLDSGGTPIRGNLLELPHVDVHRMPGGVISEQVKRRYPLGEDLYAPRQ